MTEHLHLKKFIRSFKSYLMDNPKTEIDIVDPRIKDRTAQEIRIIHAELAAFLAAGPTDLEPAEFWNKNNNSIHLGNLKSYRYFFGLMLARLNHYAK